jgi:hypothetical protein
MTRPVGFSMSINESPENSAMCNICTDLVAPGVRRISTYIGTSQQSDLCTDCAADVVTTVAPAAQTQTVPAYTSRRNRVSAETVA